MPRKMNHRKRQVRCRWFGDSVSNPLPWKDFRRARRRRDFDTLRAGLFVRRDLKRWLQQIAFGNQTISVNPYGPSNLLSETHGFASLPRGRFAFIVCNHHVGKINAALGAARNNIKGGLASLSTPNFGPSFCRLSPTLGSATEARYGRPRFARRVAPAPARAAKTNCCQPPRPTPIMFAERLSGGRGRRGTDGILKSFISPAVKFQRAFPSTRHTTRT